MTHKPSGSMSTSTSDSAIMALDDPVPSGSSLAVVEPSCVEETPHSLEQLVQRRLMQNPRLRFSSLVVRRLHDGVCLEGVMETDDRGTDINRLVRQLSGVDRVINRLVVHRTDHPKPAKAQQPPEKSPHQG